MFLCAGFFFCTFYEEVEYNPDTLEIRTNYGVCNVVINTEYENAIILKKLELENLVYNNNNWLLAYRTERGIFYVRNRTFSGYDGYKLIKIMESILGRNELSELKKDEFRNIFYKICKGNYVEANKAIISSMDLPHEP